MPVWSEEKAHVSGKPVARDFVIMGVVELRDINFGTTEMNNKLRSLPSPHLGVHSHANHEMLPSRTSIRLWATLRPPADSPFTHYYERQLWPHLGGVSDDEYHFEPMGGCWRIRPRAEARSPMATGTGSRTKRQKRRGNSSKSWSTTAKSRWNERRSNISNCKTCAHLGHSSEAPAKGPGFGSG